VKCSVADLTIAHINKWSNSFSAFI